MKLNKLVALALLAAGTVAQALVRLEGSTPAAAAIKPLSAGETTDIPIPVPTLAAGDYVVAWRATGADGHVMSGKFCFTVNPTAPPPASTGRVKIPEAIGDQHRH